MIQKIALGADLGWVSQLEALGYSWIDDAGKETDPILQCREMGVNAVRFRIFVDPPKDAFWKKKEDETCMLGYCDAKSVLAVAKRVKELDMDLMLDFHYSDHFADPMLQDVPKAWENDTDEQLEERVYAHTKEVLTLFRENGVIPKWVQVGNEINPGILLPHGSRKTAPKQLVRFLNRGYDAVKEVCPETLVITHVAGLHNESWCMPFWDNFFENGGKTDILGFSYYPYWYEKLDTQFYPDWYESKEDNRKMLRGWLEQYLQKYQKPVLIAEVGGEDTDVEGTYDLICDCVEVLQSLPEKQGLGVFYWEPEVCREILPDHYVLGAARLVGDKTLQYTKALSAYKKYM